MVVEKRRLESSLVTVNGVVQINGQVYRDCCGVATYGGWKTGTNYRMSGWDAKKGKYHVIRIGSRLLIARYRHL